jgi:multidrug resistance efflux pump
MQRLAICALLTIVTLNVSPVLGAGAVSGTADKKLPASAGGKKPEGKPAAKPAETKPADTKPTTYKVRKRLLRVDVALEGVFEATSVAEVVLRPQEWSEFEVLKAVEHGTTVKPGDLLVSIDTEKIDRAIADLERDLALARLSLQETETQLQLGRVTGPLDLAMGERSKRNIDQDMAHYLQVERPMMERTLKFMVKMAEDRLAYEQEELRQLEKMYKADDLVEETEEIILRRARDSVAQAKFGLERATTDRDSLLKISIPRAEEALKMSVQRQAIELKKTQASVPAAQRKIELSLEKMKVDLGRNQERFGRLVADRKLMNVKAPIGGIVYYGRVVRGKWIGAEMSADKLRRGARLMADDVFMTIVEPRPLTVRAAASEKQLRYVVAGMKAGVTPTAFPDLKLDAIVERVAGVPGTAKEFDTVLTLAMNAEARAVMPGMSCEVKILLFFKPDPLAIPLSALGSDEADPAKCLVALPSKAGPPVRREVAVGRRTEKLAEIVKGLSEGEEILAEFPKEKE